MKHLIGILTVAVLFSCTNNKEDLSIGTWLKINNNYSIHGTNQDILFVNNVGEECPAGTILKFGQSSEWIEIGMGTTRFKSKEYYVWFRSREAGTSNEWSDTTNYILNDICGFYLYQGKKYEATMRALQK